MVDRILIAAGGTGGHLFPAEALAHALAARGVEVHLATDHRAETYGGDFPAREVHILPSATLAGRSPVALASAGWRIVRGLAAAHRLIGRLKPAAVVGFGGYPTLPPLLAASLRGVPTVIHEANAVAGRANRFLAPRMTAIATSFAQTGLLGAAASRAVVTGNPVRPRVMAARSAYQTPDPGGAVRLLVFGGSQGARVFSELLPPALEALDPARRTRLRLTQQARPEDRDGLVARLAGLGVAADIEPFFADLPLRMADAHLVVCRSGASSVAELCVLGRPSVLVPLPHALDNDQKTNALELERAGGAVLAEQAGLDGPRLAGLLSALMDDPGRLAAMAAAAAANGRPDAVDRLADLVLTTAAGGRPATSLESGKTIP